MKLNFLRIYIGSKLISIIQSIVTLSFIEPSSLGIASVTLAKLFFIQQVSELAFGKLNIRNQRKFIDRRQLIVSIALSFFMTSMLCYISRESIDINNLTLYIIIAITLTISQLFNTSLIYTNINLYSKIMIKSQLYGFIVFIFALFITKKDGVFAIYSQTIFIAIYTIIIASVNSRIEIGQLKFYDTKYCFTVTLTSIISWSISLMDPIIISENFDFSSIGFYSL